MKKYAWILPLLLLSSGAQAHLGHAHVSFMDGLMHPLGWDHLLAMVAVGLWASRTFTGNARWLAPAAFVSSLVVGASMAHFTGIEWAGAEVVIAASVAILGVLLLLPKHLSKVIGFALVVAAGMTHGWAHGAETTVGGVFALYALGFVLTTTALHGAGVLMGSHLLATRVWLWRLASVLIGGYGAWLLVGMA